MNTIVCELRDTKNVESGENLVHELRCVSTRSRAMVTCYPGGGSRYTRHCDNAIGNGRKLTSILYLNDGWSPSDGGELVLYPSLLSGREVRVEPTINRLVLFWSDIRCPHEVLPSHRDRFAVTVWFIDREERDRREALDAAEMNSTGTSDNCTTTTQPVLSGESTSQDGTGATYLISNITWKSYSVCALDVSSDCIRITSQDSSFEPVLIKLPAPIHQNRTIASYKKKRQLLSINVRFSCSNT
mmetsp:Transcript_2869/g.4366  ORF Transcript_2869/g.4366 Transcript_2869/m.4366 type:complete len:243 (-) Transcript_2869:28-756(-)